MKILHINTFDRGGAANACLRLHEGLLNSGIESKVLVRRKSNNNFSQVYVYEPEIAQNPIKIYSARLKRIIRLFFKEIGLYKGTKLEKISGELRNLRPKGLEMISFPESDVDITNNKLFREADIIHLHWVAGFLDYKSFFKKCKKPIVWTFHDQNPFLGVEHYAEKFLGPNEQGLPIDRQFDNYELEVEEKYKQIKRKVFRNIPLRIVALCNWMKHEVVESEMFPLAEINIIPNGIDVKQFKILDKNFCRGLLNLPIDKKIILFVSDSIDNNRKGLSFLLKSFENITTTNLVICSIGKSYCQENDNKNFVKLGEIRDQRLMNVAYCAADLFVTPSFMETFGLTIVESLLCGTPVISFPNGGSCEIIRDEFNGYLTKSINVNALANSINDFFENGIKFSTKEIREDAMERFDISVQVKNMSEIYTGIFNA